MLPAQTGGIGVEVIEKEEVVGEEPKCKIHFQFISDVDQMARAQITSYQILDAKELVFGMTGEKKLNQIVDLTSVKLPLAMRATRY